MIRFTIDLEFNGFEGELLSLGLVRQDGESLYLVETPAKIEFLQRTGVMDPWVDEHVIPILYSAPVTPIVLSSRDWGPVIGEFLYRDTSDHPQVIADWPSDIADLCRLLMTGPGTAVPMPQQTHLTILRHIDVYPTTLEGAIRHNALWDAMALKRWVEEQE